LDLKELKKLKIEQRLQQRQKLGIDNPEDDSNQDDTKIGEKI